MEERRSLHCSTFWCRSYGHETAPSPNPSTCSLIHDHAISRIHTTQASGSKERTSFYFGVHLLSRDLGSLRSSGVQRCSRRWHDETSPGENVLRETFWALEVTRLLCSSQAIHLLHVNHEIKLTHDLGKMVYLQRCIEYKKYLPVNCPLTSKAIGRRECAVIHIFTDEETENSGSLE